MKSATHTLAVRRDRRLAIGTTDRGPLAHQLFRFPAKFHPPVARRLVERFSKPGDLVLDPFCGSGTLLLEAALAGRNAVGVDIDPLAVFVSRVKCARVKPHSLRTSFEVVSGEIELSRRPAKEYLRRQHRDISESTLLRVSRDEDLWIPAIPNLQHWFRRYVLIDLARILQSIQLASIPESHRSIFLLCFASILRSASNADPVPVSGLEVTSHMIERERAGRTIDPHALYNKCAERALSAFLELSEYSTPTTTVKVFDGSATNLAAIRLPQVDAVITSPPYHNAVDYYRRHTLEMYWLGLVDSHASRLALRPNYIGQASIKHGDPLVTAPLPESTLVKWWASKMGRDTRRGIAFRHYVQAMHRCFGGLADRLKKGAAAVFVVGRSRWNGYEMRTDRLFEAIAGADFALEEVLWYPVKNRYMSYSRQNGANINRELVLVFRKK